MRINDVKHYFSAARIDRYLTATQQSAPKAIKLYKANLKVSQALHPLLGILEVVLRNRLNDVLKVYFQDDEWILNQTAGFMVDHSLTYVHHRTGIRKTNDFLKREVNKAKRRLQRSGTPITTGKIIAEQTLGFWTSLFEIYHYRLLRGRPIQIFQTLPPNYGRKQVNDELEKVRLIRNRINHNEPICFDNNSIDFTKTLEAHQSILNLLTWIDPNLVKLIKDLDRVGTVLTRARNI